MAITHPHSNPPKYPIGTYPGGTEGAPCNPPTYTTSLAHMAMPAGMTDTDDPTETAADERSEND